MTPEERALMNGLFDRLKNASPTAKEADPGNDPGLGVDWGSNIDPGPGPDPGKVDPTGGSDSGSRAV